MLQLLDLQKFDSVSLINKLSGRSKIEKPIENLDEASSKLELLTLNFRVHLKSIDRNVVSRF